jgi:hypothetical protein
MIEDSKKLIKKVVKALLIFAPMYWLPIIPCKIYGWEIPDYFASFAVIAGIYNLIVVRGADRYNIRF